MQRARGKFWSEFIWQCKYKRIKMFKFGVIICILFTLNFCFAKDLNASNVEKNSTSMLKTLKQMDIPFSGNEYEIENLSKLDDKMLYVFVLDGKDFKLVRYFSSDNNGPMPEYIVQMDFINHRLEKSANLLYQGNEEYKRYEECIEKYRSFDDAQEKDDYDAILIRKTYEIKTQKILLSEVKKVDYIDGRWLDDLQNSKELVKILKIDFWGDEYLGDNADELARCVADKI